MRRPEPRCLGALFLLAAGVSGCGESAAPAATLGEKAAAPGGIPSHPVVEGAAGQSTERWIEIRPAVLDLGLVSRDETWDCSFEVVNVSTRPLRITNVAGSCACQGFQYDRIELEPGASQPLHVKVHSSGRSSKRLDVEIQVNSPGFSVSSAHIDYFAKEVPICQPREVNFGRRSVGAIADATLRLRYKLPADVPVPPEQVTLVDAGPVTAVVEPPSVAGEGLLVSVETVVKFLLPADAPQTIRGKARIESAAHEPVEVSVRGLIHCGWYLNADRLSLGVLKLGKEKRESLRLFHTLDGAPRVQITSSVPWLSAEVVPGGSERSVCLEVLARPVTEGAFDETLTIRTDSLDHEEVVHVVGRVQGA